MKKLLLVYLVVLAATLAAIFFLGSQLPDRVATHFNGAGSPDGWMPRGTAMWSSSAFATGFSAFIPALLFFIRFLPGRLLNVPRKEYWAQPDNYRRACAFLFRFSFWIATLCALFVCGCFVLLVQANRFNPPALNSAAMWFLAALYLGSLVMWTVGLLRFFSAATPPDPART